LGIEMAIQSIDNMISSISAGKTWRQEFNKITGGTAYVAGRSYDMAILNGNPVANAYTGTALNFQACNGSSAFGIFNGGNATPDIKHLLNMGALTTAATGIPGTLYFVDLQGYWPGISNNTTAAQTILGTPTLRHTNGNGCRLYQVQTAIAGATAQNMALSYTDQGGTAGNTLPVTVSMTASAIVGQISHSGVAANNYGPFLPLAAGDYGVRNVASVTMSAANTGTFALCLAKPIAQIAIGVTGLYHEKDLLNQIPSLPIIPDDACIVPIFVAGAAVAGSTTFAGHIETVWG
jgi:hypothetical protein